MRKLQDGFAPVPDQVHDRIESALTQLKQDQPAARPARLGMVLALVAALLLLTGAALAMNHFGVLDYLFHTTRDQAPQSLETMVQTVQERWEKDGVLISVDEIMTDGLSTSFVIHASTRNKPYFLTVDSVEVAGEKLGYLSQGCELPGRYIEHPVEVTGKETQFGVSVIRSDWAVGKVPVTIRLALMETPNEPVIVGPDNIALWTENKPEDFLRKGQVMALMEGSARDPSYVLEPVGFAYRDEVRAQRGDAPFSEVEESFVEYMRDCGNLSVTHWIEMSFELDVPEPAWIAHYRPSDDSVMPVEATLAEISPLATRLDLMIVLPDETAYQRWIIDHNEIDYLDETGEQAQFLPMYGRGYNGQMSPRPQEDGSYRMRYRTILQGFEKPPDKLTILPRTPIFSEEISDEPVTWYHEYSVTLEKID